VFDPRSGAPLLKPRGRAQAQQADQLEAASRLARDPQQAQKLQQQAAALRQDATVNGSYTIKEPAARKEVVDNISANQGLVDVIGDINAELAKGPSAFDRTKWAELKSAGEVAKANYIAAHAGKLTSREMDAIGDAFNFDADSMFSRGANVGKMQASLGTLQRYAVADATRTLHTHGINDTWEPRATQATTALPLNGQTAVEAEQGAHPSIAGRIERRVLNPTGWDKGSVWDVEGRAENTGGSGSGLAADDEKRVRGEMNRFARGADAEDQLRGKIANLDTLSPTERARVLQQAQSVGGDRESSISRLATYANSPRAAISNSVLSVLREQPALYREVLARLPEDRRKEIDQFDGVTGKLRAQFRDPATGLTPEHQAYIQQVITRGSK